MHKKSTKKEDHTPCENAEFEAFDLPHFLAHVLIS